MWFGFPYLFLIVLRNKMCFNVGNEIPGMGSAPGLAPKILSPEISPREPRNIVPKLWDWSPGANSPTRNFGIYFRGQIPRSRNFETDPICPPNFGTTLGSSFFSPRYFGATLGNTFLCPGTEMRNPGANPEFRGICKYAILFT